MSSRSSDYLSKSDSKRYRSSYLVSSRRDNEFCSDGYSRGDVGPIKIHFSYQKVYYGTDRHDGGFQKYQCHHIAYPWHNLAFGIIQLMILVVLNLVLLLVIVGLVWILGPPAFTPKMLIVGLMMVILCHFVLVIIQT